MISRGFLLGSSGFTHRARVLFGVFSESCPTAVFRNPFEVGHINVSPVPNIDVFLLQGSGLFVTKCFIVNLR